MNIWFSAGEIVIDLAARFGGPRRAYLLPRPHTANNGDVLVHRHPCGVTELIVIGDFFMKREDSTPVTPRKTRIGRVFKRMVYELPEGL